VHQSLQMGGPVRGLARQSARFPGARGGNHRPWNAGVSPHIGCRPLVRCNTPQTAQATHLCANMVRKNTACTKTSGSARNFGATLPRGALGTWRVENVHETCLMMLSPPRARIQ